MEPIGSHTLGSFKIAAHLDSGGMADVFLSHRIEQSAGSDGQALAVIKVLRERFRTEPEITAMFRDEARIMTRLSHPNVVQVFEHGEADDRPYIAMEYLAGDHLGVLSRVARATGEELGFALITRICVQVANALDYLHRVADEHGRSLHLVHRDISPQNIFVTYDGRVKILDFGIALTEDRSVATRTGMLKGKLRYMSPEQINSKPLDSRSDLFSMGIVMWELITGQRLFKAESEFKTMKLICEETIPSPDEIRTDLPVALEAIVMGLLRRPVEQRYASAADVRSALMSVLREDLADSHPDEITRGAARLLGERKRHKQAAIDSLRASHNLQAYLFGDLNRDEESSTSDQREQPAPAGPPRQLAPAVLPSPLASPRPAAPEPELPRPAPRRRSAWPLAAVFVLILGAGGLTAWLLWPAASPTGNPRAGTEPVAQAPAEPPEEPTRPTPAEPAQPTVADPPAEPAQPDATEPPAEPTDPAVATVAQADPTADPPAAEPEAGEEEDKEDEEEQPEPIGFLMVKTTPVTQVFLGDRFVGKTPITEMELAPGSYQITLINREHNIELKVPITIRRGEVSSFQYIF